MSLVCIPFLFVDVTNVVFIQDPSEPFSPYTPSWPSLDQGDAITSVSPSPSAPTLSHSNTPTPSEPSSAGTGMVKAEAKLSSSTQKSRGMMKRTLQDVFAEGSAKENEMLECLRMQRHERALGEQELKRRKLDQKLLEKQHQRERERDAHEYRMMQMQMQAGVMPNSRGAPAMRNERSEGFGLLAELNDPMLPPGSPYST